MIQKITENMKRNWKVGNQWVKKVLLKVFKYRG